jgi:CRP/FNR family transcriptional regulator
MHIALNAPTAEQLVFMQSAASAATRMPQAATGPPCASCRHRQLCLPGDMPASDLQRLEGLMLGQRRIREGQTAFREGDDFRFLYAVRSGTFKCTAMSREGREQVTAFRIAGEIMGLDALADGTHTTTVTALEDAEVCAIPYVQLLELSVGTPGLQQALSRLMSHEIVREHHLMVMLGSMNAEERLAAFLLNLSQRMQARGYSPTEFHLRMSRAEIGSYLGLTLETVSRACSAFQHQGLMQVNKKHISHLDLDGLRETIEAGVH